VNDAPRREANCVMKLKVVKNTPRLCLFALGNILPGQELLYDYGDNNNLWWRHQAKQVQKLNIML